MVSAAHGIGALALAEPIGELNPVVVSATASGPGNAITSPTKVRDAAMSICE